MWISRIVFSQLGSGLNFLFHLLLFLENCLVIILQLHKLNHSLDRPRVCFDFISNLKQKPKFLAIELDAYQKTWHHLLGTRVFGGGGFFPPISSSTELSLEVGSQETISWLKKRDAVPHSSLGSTYLGWDGAKPPSATPLANPIVANRRLSYLQATSLCAFRGFSMPHIYTPWKLQELKIWA